MEGQIINKTFDLTDSEAEHLKGRRKAADDQRAIDERADRLMKSSGPMNAEDQKFIWEQIQKVDLNS